MKGTRVLLIAAVPLGGILAVYVVLWLYRLAFALFATVVSPQAADGFATLTVFLGSIVALVCAIASVVEAIDGRS